MERDPFKEYIEEKEPGKRDKAYAWHTAMGLQDVDGLKPSNYLVDTAIKNIEGEITLDEAENLLHSYYEERTESSDDRTEEADKVALNIAKVLSEKAFSFTPNEYLSIHRKLFIGVYKHAGKMRDYNITKKEWVLDGETVMYGSASELRATLNYEFNQEKNFDYKGLAMEEIIHHLAKFISGVWQIHVFCEGNTRTTAVFFIKYLRALGFDVMNDIFAENAWYFRNSLVRANYTNLAKGIHETTEYLEEFLENLLLNKQHDLKNRYLHVSTILDDKKVDIDETKVDIDISESIANKLKDTSTKTIDHALALYNIFATNQYFGRSDVVSIIKLKDSSASKFLSKLLELEVIEPVKGHGKGKYAFKTNHIDS